MPCVDIKSSVGQGLIPRQVTPQEDVSSSLDRIGQVGRPAVDADEESCCSRRLVVLHIA